jgi:hypothetical protein
MHSLCSPNDRRSPVSHPSTDAAYVEKDRDGRDAGMCRPARARLADAPESGLGSLGDAGSALARKVEVDGHLLLLGREEARGQSDPERDARDAHRAADQSRCSSRTRPEGSIADSAHGQEVIAGGISRAVE